MIKEKINDFIDSAKGEIKQILLEEGAPVLVKEVAESLGPEIVAEAASEVAGVMVPGIGNIVLSYKQKRMERNLENYIGQIVARQDEINEYLSCFEAETVSKMQYLFGIISDYVPNVRQEQKIEYIVNGFVNLSAGANMSEDYVLTYYDTLEQLNLLDLRVLKVYCTNRYIGVKYEDSILKIMQDYGMDYGEMNLIQQKLERLGLILSKNDTDLDENIRNISAYMEAIQKGKKAPKLKLNRIKRSESYRITKYGSKFMEFFLNMKIE